jgi:cyclic beta-1,2-glucan synthetase
VPENALLSHDLFEGIFARAGLVTDIELFEEFPSHYEVAAARQHRWARGDWQLLPWILGHASAASGARRCPWLPLISRWKLLDNLRRTLSAPAAVLTLLIGWTLPFTAPLICTTFVLVTIALPALLPFLTGLIPHRRGIAKRSHARAVVTDLVYAAAHVALAVTLLAHQAWLMTDAIVRTLYRVYVTRRKLLEWVTAAQAKAGSDYTLGRVYRRMGGRWRSPPPEVSSWQSGSQTPGRSRCRACCSGGCRPWWRAGSACHRARLGLNHSRQVTSARCA